MGWLKESISDGEIDGLHRAALAACNEDSCFPRWRGNRHMGGGECYNMSAWLVERLGGHVGASRGHYAWLSPDQRFVIDLTGHHGKNWTYSDNGNPHYHLVQTIENERTRRFSKRANHIFENLDRFLRFSLDYAGDTSPAQEPQREDDRERFNDSWGDPEQYWHDEPSSTTPEGVYQFVYANGALEVSPNHSHDELSQHTGIQPNHSGPFAAGHVVVTNGTATWEVQANVNLHSFFRILKDASKQYGWQWGGLTDAEGQPISEAFEPKKSAKVLHYVFIGDHLYLGRTSAAELALGADPDDFDGQVREGTLRITGERVEVHPVYVDLLPHLFEWASDNGLTLYAGNDNVIKKIPDLQQENLYDPQGTQDPVEPQPVDERMPSGLYQCPACQQLFPSWHEYQKHRREKESWGDPDRTESGPLPESDHDIYGDGAHYHEMRQTPGVGTVAYVLPARTWKEAARVDGFMKYAKAFNYDNDNHLFYVAYRNGDPLGYVAVKPDGEITMMHSAIENEGIGQALFAKLTKHFSSLSTHAAHDKTAALLKRFGWVQSKGQLWRWSQGQDPKDLIDAPLPFIYDVEDDKINVGSPGARTSDIPGRFTPGGIVEGTYEPGGKVVIRTMTSMPYTVRHMIELWYYSQPHLEVKSVHLQDDAGKDTRLASSDIGSYVKSLAAMDPAVHVAANTLQMAGGEVFAVGGAVRDAIMGKEPKDIDLMVTGLPAEKVSHLLESLPGRVDFTGKDFGVFRYRHKGANVEIALPRSEHSTGVGHKEFDVKADHAMKPEDDLYRRDFSANAMAVNLRNGALLDPFGGTADIGSGTLRALSDRSLSEDPLRVVRALVAHGRHGLNPDETTRAQMASNAHVLQHLPAERVQAELDKIMGSDNPTKAIRLAHETGVLKHILPEVDEAFGYDQNNPHHELELGEHLLNVLDRISQKTKDPDLRLAALLHDIGKPKSAWKDPETGGNHYYEHHLDDGTTLGADHELVGADMARERMNALRYSRDRIDRIHELVKNHMFGAFSTPKGARRFMNTVGNHADDLLALREADQGGKGIQYPGNPALSVDRQRQLVSRVRTQEEPTSLSQLAIDGNDLIKIGFPPSPLLGETLRYLTNQVVDNPSLNTPRALLEMASAYAKLQGDQNEESIQEDQGSGAQAPEAFSASVRSSESQKLAQGDEEAQVEPEFPDSADAEEIHDQALMDHGQAPEALRNPAGLESAMGRASNYWHYGQGTPGERIADSAGALAHGIGMAQSFVDGNKRTSYHTTRYFLDSNGFPHLSPMEHDDEEFADHLIGHGQGTHSLEDTQQLFRSRLRPEERSQ